jgi:hypothetical protein
VSEENGAIKRDSFVILWDAPSYNGGSNVESFEIEWKLISDTDF